MRITMVTGSYPPEACGVGDYTHRLVSALQSEGVDVHVVCGSKWGIANTPALLKEIRAHKPDVLHIQYPTRGYETAIGPQILASLVPSVVTLHEFSHSKLLRKISAYPFFMRHKRIIFTTAYEMNGTTRRAPWIKRNSSIIPIGSNMPIGTSEKDYSSREIVYFGLIEPRKGLEEVIELARLIKQASLPFSVRIIGLSVACRAAYETDLKRQTEDMPVVWDLGNPPDKTSEKLSSSLIAYAPFPTGVSVSRGSVLALLSNGVAVVTTQGDVTTNDILGAVQIAENPKEALNTITSLFSDPDKLKAIAATGRDYTRQFSWDSIAEEHIKIYQSLTKAGSKSNAQFK